MNELRKKYPWPKEKPDVESSTHGWFDNEEKVKAYSKILLANNPKIIVEIGSWMGKSTRLPLTLLPVTMICIDPWNKDGDIEKNYKYNLPNKIRNKMDILYETFLVNCWTKRSNIIPIREKSIKGIKIVKDHGIEPDLILIDGDHSYNIIKADIEACYDTFPKAILVGDDYNWKKNGKTPVKKALSDFCKVRDEKVKTFGNLWVMRDKGGV